MNNPLRDVSRPKALVLAGAVAGAFAISGIAAALNVGLLSSQQSKPFVLKPIATSPVSADVPSSTPADGPVQVVYQDVYEHVAGSPAPTTTSTAPLAAPPGAAPAALPTGGADTGTVDEPAGAEPDDHGEVDDHEEADHVDGGGEDDPADGEFDD